MSESREDSEAGTPLDPDGLDPGTSVLVAGPALSDKRRLMFDLVGGAPDRSALLVTTKKRTEQLRSSFLDSRADPDAWTVSMVDCVSRTGGFGSVSDTADVKYLSSARDLTGIGIAVSGFMRECYHDDGRTGTRVGLHALSTLLMYTELRRVYQFMHVLTSRIGHSGFEGVFTLDTTNRDGDDVAMLSQVVDSVVEVRDTDSGPELRVRGDSFGPRAWTPF